MTQLPPEKNDPPNPPRDVAVFEADELEPPEFHQPLLRRLELPPDELDDDRDEDFLHFSGFFSSAAPPVEPVGVKPGALPSGSNVGRGVVGCSGSHRSGANIE
jgi:hypothetical protein